MSKSKPNPNDTNKPTLLQVILSVLAALFGVQTDKSRQRDFTHGNPWVFVMAGLVGVTLFVLILYFVVQLIVV